MGGAVSSGRDNDELIDNLMGSNYIRSSAVECVFRAVDRSDYMSPNAKQQAYKDLAWRMGVIHMSAPCIYSEVMEGLELAPCQSFLNIGSGTGYLSTMVGLILGSGGINHGIEIERDLILYSNGKLKQFLEFSPAIDEHDFCEPIFFKGNALCLAPLQAMYDRVYCGASCPDTYSNYMQQLIKVGGILVMPLNDQLVQIRRVSEKKWVSKNLLSVSFANLKEPMNKDKPDVELLKLDDHRPASLQSLSRSVVRGCVRAGVVRVRPDLDTPPTSRLPPPNRPRHICIPLDEESDVENLNALHNLDPTNGAQEMNALLNLVLSMGQNRVAGALRFDSLDSPSDSSDDADDVYVDEENDDDLENGNGETPDRTEAVTPIEDPDMVEVDINQRDDDADNDDHTDDNVETKNDNVETKNDRRDVDNHNESNNLTKSVEVDEKVQFSCGHSDEVNQSSSSNKDIVDKESSPSSSLSKRQKFDSGLGEENTPSSASSPDKTDNKTDTDNESDINLHEDDTDTTGPRRRRMPKRSRSRVMSSSSSSSSDVELGANRVRSRPKRRPSPPSDVRQERRRQLSMAMRQAVNDLPLPQPLKSYVNYYRSFS